jgi:asparagine synthase (glutamine-hydrolysing)
VSSVEYRLISDVPFGTFLSGGIDSSLVTAVAQSLRPNPINTFSIGFWDREYDESPHAQKIADYLGTQHNSMYVTEADAIEWIPRLTGIYDEPFADSSAIPTLMVSQMARRHVTMTLSGDGGDELFMGYGAYQWAKRLANPLAGWLRWPASMLLPHGPMHYRRAAGLFEKVPRSQLKSHIFSQEQYLFSRKEIRELLREQQYTGFELQEEFTSPVSQLSPAEQQAFFDLTYYLPDDLLVKVDRASMYFALETRVPLLDYRIVEWALNLPVSMKLKNGESKWLLKQLLYQYLPEEFFQRPKRGFAIPLKKWLKSELKDFAMDYLNADAIRKAGLLDPDRVKKLLNAFYDGNQDYLYNRIWQLLVLQKWILENRF